MSLDTILRYIEHLVSIETIIYILGIIFFSIVFRTIIKFGLFRLIKLIVSKQSSRLTKDIENFNIFKSAVNLAPLMVIYIGVKYFLTIKPSYHVFTLNIIQILLIIVFLQLIGNIISFVINEIKNANHLNAALLRTFHQVIKILLFFIGIISIVSILLNKSPLIIFSSLGALSAILLLIFKDSILGLVASIQVSLLGIVKEGDWIEMNKYNADGTILDINLSSIRVQNWDKTITTIPTYALVSEPVKNWRGMEVANCRRIKRSIFIDIDSIKPCSEPLLTSLKRINLLDNYFNHILEDINSHNKHQENNTYLPNIRSLTNIGLFRQYIVEYIKTHPNINQNATILIRQLSPTQHGLPLEVYCFTSTTDWVAYEDIQSSIFDHLLSIIQNFELKVFQFSITNSPSQ